MNDEVSRIGGNAPPCGIAPIIRLPREIRDEIYRYLLSTKYAMEILSTQVRWTNDGCSKPITSDFQEKRLCTLHFHTSIILANCQINREAMHVLYHENKFIFLRVYLELDFFCFCPSIILEDGRIVDCGYHYDVCFPKIIADGKRASLLKQYAMGVQIHYEGLELANKQEYVVDYKTLPVICQRLALLNKDPPTTLRYAIVDVSLANTHNEVASDTLGLTARHRHLLEPFTTLHSINHFRISGPVSPAYKNHLI